MMMLRRYVCALFGHAWAVLFQGVRECSRCKARQCYMQVVRMNAATGEAKYEWKWRTIRSVWGWR